MANAKKCDRCGKYYSIKDHKCDLRYSDVRYYEKYTIDEEYIIPVSVTFTDDLSCSNYYKFELCPDCMRELINAITTKEED